jgi:serine/threonine protein kinase
MMTALQSQNNINNHDTEKGYHDVRRSMDGGASPGRIGRVLAGRYRIELLLGQGAMGEVYVARDLKRRQLCAVKLVFPGAALSLQAHRRFIQEAKVVARLFHPNIVEVREFNEDSDGTKFLVMELLDGIELQTVLSRQGALPLPRTLEILRGAGAALQYAHDLGIVHRDIKPDNIFLSRVSGAGGVTHEVVKVLDFGLAKLFRDACRPDLTESGHEDQPVTKGIVVGTPAYLPPEAAMAEVGAVDPRADQWSLAVVAFQMLSGRLPFEHKNPYKLCQMICSEPPQSLQALAPGLPAHIYSAIEVALAKSREQRFPSIKAFLRALDNATPAESQSVPRAAVRIAKPPPVPFDVLKTVQYSAEEMRVLASQSRRDSEPVPKVELDDIATAPYSDPPAVESPPSPEPEAARHQPDDESRTVPRLPGLTRTFAEPAPASQGPRSADNLPALLATPLDLTFSDCGPLLPQAVDGRSTGRVQPLAGRASLGTLQRLLIGLGLTLVVLSLVVASIAVWRLQLLRAQAATAAAPLLFPVEPPLQRLALEAPPEPPAEPPEPTPAALPTRAAAPAAGPTRRATFAAPHAALPRTTTSRPPASTLPPLR